MQADELWHFYGGAPLQLLQYDPASRKLVRHVLGGIVGGATAVAVIPTGVWQAARSLDEYSLVGCTVGPGFEFADFRFVCDLPSHREHFKGELAPFADLL